MEKCFRNRILLITLFVVGSISVSWSQTISGVVKSESDRQPLAGVTIQLLRASSGTTTDEQGKFSLSNVNIGDSIRFSFVGYQGQTIAIEDRDDLEIMMKPTASSLDQLVVVGYGTQKKSSLTSSISRIENDKLDQVPSGRVETALVGRIPGVNISTVHDRPGEDPEINIRGYGSISAGNSPLIVVDGVPGGSLAQLDMNDVASFEVLKDASAAAIYGSRGAGGVILVTTKKGNDGKPVVSFNGYTGVSVPKLHNDWIMGEEWYDLLEKYQNRAFAATGGDVSIPMVGDPRRPIEFQLDPAIKDLPHTDWEKAVSQTATIQNYNLSVRGGNENVKYYISGVLGDEGGTIKTAYYKTYSFRANIDVKISDAVDLGVELNPRFTKRRVAGGGTMNNLMKIAYFVPPTKVDGKYPRTAEYAFGHSGQENPYTSIYGTKDYRTTFTNLGNLFANIRLTEGLHFRTSLGTNVNHRTNNYFKSGIGDPQTATAGYIDESNFVDLVNENVFNYTKTFNEDHDLGAVLGASYQLRTSQATRMTATNNSFNNDIVETLNNAIINPSNSTSSKTRWGLISYFGRANYTFKEKYLVSASLRRDGSSRFGESNKWGYFPAASAAWRISKENFMAASSNTISELKLRASYGVTGNFNIGDFQYLGAVGNAVYSPDNKTVNGIAQTSIANPNLSWEKMISYDFGLDVGLFKNRVSVNLDYYDKRTNGMLYQINIPAVTGFTNAIQNVGVIKNSGFEVEVSSKNLAGAFEWTTFFNLSTQKNEVLSLGGVEERINTVTQGMDWILRVGEPMFSYYPYKMIGIFQDQEEIDNTPHISGNIPGDPIIEDRNGDGKISTEDRYIAGSFMPKLNIGMTNQFSWKNFDLIISLQSSLGAKMYNEEQLFYQGPNLGTLRGPINNQWWSKDDPGDGKTPAIALSQLYSYITNTDYYLEDASYLNLRNLNIGYNISSLVKNIGISYLRVYVSMTNLIVITNKDFHGYNPEGYTSGGVSGINSTPGFNIGSEPMGRRIVLGFNINL